jgi:hypothetical protein
MATIRIPSGMKIVSAEALERLERKTPVYPTVHFGWSTELLPVAGCFCSACDMAASVKRAAKEEAR